MALKHVCVALRFIWDWIISNSGYRCFTSEYRIHWTIQLKQCNYFWWRLISGRNELAQSFQSKMLFHPIANPLWRRFPSWKSIKSSAKHYKYVVHWKSISRLRHRIPWSSRIFDCLRFPLVGLWVLVYVLEVRGVVWVGGIYWKLKKAVNRF